MTATNHALTGAYIGISIGHPLLAVPLAFASHFVLDSLPHFGSDKFKPSHKYFPYYLATEAYFCFLIVLLLIVFQPVNWFVAVISAFIATTPDFMWVGEYIRARQHKKYIQPKHWVSKFHKNIQWYQKENGLYVEIVWFIIFGFTLAKMGVFW